MDQQGLLSTFSLNPEQRTRDHFSDPQDLRLWWPSCVFLVCGTFSSGVVHSSPTHSSYKLVPRAMWQRGQAKGWRAWRRPETMGCFSGREIRVRDYHLPPGQKSEWRCNRVGSLKKPQGKAPGVSAVLGTPNAPELVVSSRQSQRFFPIHVSHLWFPCQDTCCWI